MSGLGVSIGLALDLGLKSRGGANVPVPPPTGDQVLLENNVDALLLENGADALLTEA